MKKHRYSEPPLSLELICGASDAPPDHPGYWEGLSEDLLAVHPGQAAVRDALAARGINVDVWAHKEHGVDYSDAYVRFYPEDVEVVARIIREIGHLGDILDIKEELSEEDYDRVMKVAEREGWQVER